MSRSRASSASRAERFAVVTASAAWATALAGAGARRSSRASWASRAERFAVVTASAAWAIPNPAATPKVAGRKPSASGKSNISQKAFRNLLARLDRVEAELARLKGKNGQRAADKKVRTLLDTPYVGMVNAGTNNAVRYFAARLIFVNPTSKPITIKRDELRLNVEGKTGLVEVLNGSASADQAVTHTSTPGVDVIPSGNCGPDMDSELIAGDAFGRSLDQWKQSYDLVLLDSPPILPVADARILAGKVDGAILTLRASHCRKEEVFGAISLLASSGCKPLGTVLVGADQASGYSGYGRYSYSARIVT